MPKARPLALKKVLGPQSNVDRRGQQKRPQDVAMKGNARRQVEESWVKTPGTDHIANTKAKQDSTAWCPGLLPARSRVQI